MSRLEDAIAALDDSQRAAFEVESHCAVLAPPGSGKTRLLVARLAHSLVEEVSAPQGAACITLTNNAATEVQQRFDVISSDTRPNLFIGTVHAFSYKRIVRPFANLLGYSALASSRVGRASELAELWSDSLDDAGIPDDERSYLKPTVDKYRNSLATHEEWKSLGKYPIAARDSYLNLMDERGVLDFGRMVEHAVSFVEGESAVRESLSAAFPRIFVDEYQDLAPGLDRIVRALSFGSKTHSSTLFAVGDVDQAIYRWTGTDPKLLLGLSSLPGVAAKRLSTNYRSGANLVEVTRRLLVGGQAPATTRNGGMISTHKLRDGLAAQARFIAERALNISDAGTPLKEIAVFCGTNAIGKDVAAVLSSSGLPVYFRSGEDWETPLSILLERICAWATHGQDKSEQKLSQVTSELTRSVQGLSADSVRQLWAIAILADPRGDAFEFVTALSSQLKSGATPDAIATVDEELHGLLEALETGSLADIAIETLGSRRITLGKIYLTTLTSSKGLEFDHTFVVGLEDGQIPFYRSFDDAELLGEEKRKFYVAITRAREHVYLLWSGFNVNQWGRRFPNPVSRFVTELGAME